MSLPTETRCGRCAGPNTIWCAPSPLWNAVMRGGSINGEEPYGGIVCPTCFAVLAEEKGIACDWRLNAQLVHSTVEAVTPSGRVWDADEWRWVDAKDQVAGEGWQALYDHAEADNKRLRAALAFYANASTYALPLAFSPIWSDRGRNAKQAVNGGEQ